MRYLSLILVALSVACGGSSQTEAPPTTGSVAGLVTDSLDGTPIGGARLQVGSQGTITDADGRYTISGLAPSTGLELSVTKSGFFQANVTVAVTAGETTSRNLGLVRLALAGSVDGTVTDGSSGTPLGGVVVTLGMASTTTDLGGHYRLTGTAPGTGLAMTATRTGYFQLGTTVDVTAGQVTTKDLGMTAIPGTGTVAGTITDTSTGAALEGVVVTVGLASTTTDLGGHYQLTNLAPGSGLAMTATRTGYFQLGTTVDVTAGQVATKDLGMTAIPGTGTVEGTVTDFISGAPLADVVVTIGTASAITGADGRYTISGLEPSTALLISATHPGHYQFHGTVAVTAEQVTVEDFTMFAVSPTGDVSGLVSDSRSGLPLSDVVVTVGGFSARTDASGSYGLTSVATGTGLAITATKAGYYQSVGTADVVAGQTTTHDIALAHVVGDVAGVVTDWKTGSPVQGVTVALDGTTQTTDASGAYTFTGLLPGTGLAITAVKAGYLDFAGTVDVVADQIITRNIGIILNPCLPNPCGLSGVPHGTCVPNGPLPVCTCDATWTLPLCATCDTGYYLEGGTCKPGLGVYVSTTGDDTTGDGTIGKPYRTITKGLSGTTAHTVVRVAAGSYGAGETFPLKPADGVSIVGDGAAVTSITGSISTNNGPPLAIVSYLANVTLPDWTRLEGLTITNTGGVAVLAYYAGSADVNISPVIRHNVINGTLTSYIGGINGAMTVSAYAYGNPNVVLSPTISDNVITGNGTSSNLMPGLAIQAYQGATVAPLVTGNTIVFNGPFFGGSGPPASVVMYGGSPVFDHDTFTANAGVGVYMFSYSLTSALSPSFVANKISWSPPPFGLNGGVVLEEQSSGTGTPSFADNTIVGTSGPAFMVYDYDRAALTAIDLGGGSTGSHGRNTIRGTTDLDNTQNPISVSATHNWWSDNPPTRIVQSTTVGVAVTTAPANDQVLSFTVLPVVGAVAGGDTITVTAGPNSFFLDDIGATHDRISVTVGGVPATNVSVSASGDLLTAVTPAGTAGAAQVVVTNPAGQTGSAAFTYGP